MAERQQSVTPRERRQSAKRAAPAPKRRPRGSVRWVRWALVGVLGFAASLGYFAVADSATFALRRVEIVGAERVSADRLEDVVRRVAGPSLLDADLDEVRAAVAEDRYVRSASVVRVLPDTLRVELEERKPTVVVRLKSGRMGWVDSDGRLLDDYVPEAGSVMPPPLAGYEEGDRSERVTAENRERVARYEEIRDALEADGLWDKLDEVDVRYLNDVKVHLADSSIVVRIGDRDFRGRLQTALGLIAAVRRGDSTMLARYHVPDVGRLLASADSIEFVDMARTNGSVTLGYSSARSTASEPPPPAAVFKAGTYVKSVPPAPARTESREPAAKPAAKQGGSAPAKASSRPRRTDGAAGETGRND
jgi:cell division protein FtsQ